MWSGRFFATSSADRFYADFLTRQAVQRVADELEREGFIAFSENPHHRRAKLASLTAKGRVALDEVRNAIVWANEVVAGINSTALSTAAKLGETLRRRLADVHRNEGEA